MDLLRLTAISYERQIETEIWINPEQIIWFAAASRDKEKPVTRKPVTIVVLRDKETIYVKETPQEIARLNAADV